MSIDFERDGRPFSYDFPERELLPGWDEKEDDLDDLDGLGEDVDDLVAVEADLFARLAEDPAMYAEWQRDRSLRWPPDDEEDGDDPIVTV